MSNLTLKYVIFKIISKFSVEKNCIWINTQWGSWKACELAMNCGNCFNSRRRKYCFCVGNDTENGSLTPIVSLQNKERCYNLCKGKKYNFVLVQKSLLKIYTLITLRSKILTEIWLTKPIF